VERKAINACVITALDAARQSQYSGQCASYGEALLNCYLDLFITFTVRGTPKDIAVKPSFLVNPTTGSVLELDVMFQDFRLAFEFQGEHHYTTPKVQAKDAFKLAKCGALQRILIPVNISQLNSHTLQSLIANSIKDHLRLNEVITSKDPSRFLAGAASSRQLTSFSKAVQRLYSAESVFREAMDWVDSEAVTYITNQSSRNPVSATTAAPRQGPASPDLSLAQIYQGLRYVTAIRKTA
jgi:hypothetical protein